MSRVAPVQAALFLLTASCFMKPDRPGGTTNGDGGNGGGSDAKGSDSGASCTTIADDFTTSSGPACGSWGTASTGGTLTRTNGALQLGIVTGGVETYCRSQAFNLSNGVSLQLVQPLLNSPAEHNFLRVTLQQQTTTIDVGIQAYHDFQGSKITTLCPTPQTVTIDPPYDSSRQWIKMTFGMGPTSTPQVTYYTSPTGEDGTWTALKMPCILTTDVNISMGSAWFGGGGSASAGTAVVDNFNVKTCPP